MSSTTPNGDTKQQNPDPAIETLKAFSKAMDTPSGFAGGIVLSWVGAAVMIGFVMIIISCAEKVDNFFHPKHVHLHSTDEKFNSDSQYANLDFGMSARSDWTAVTITKAPSDPVRPLDAGPLYGIDDVSLGNYRCTLRPGMALKIVSTSNIGTLLMYEPPQYAHHHSTGDKIETCQGGESFYVDDNQLAALTK